MPRPSKSSSEKFPKIHATIRPDQVAKANRLKAERRLSAIFQAAIDAA